MTTPDSALVQDPSHSMAGMWTACGPMFRALWTKDDSSVSLSWRNIHMATISGGKFSIFHTVDEMGLSDEYDVSADTATIRKYIVSVSHLDTILRNWPESGMKDSSAIELTAGGTTHAEIDFDSFSAVYVLITGNRGSPQRTCRLDSLARYTEWIVHSIENRETSHTALFIDSMRRL